MAWKLVAILPTAPVSGGIMPVTLLICARNECANLRRHLPEWLAQDHPDFRILVVDDASTDDSLTLLKEWRRKDVRLTFLHLPLKTHTGKKAALAAGLAAVQTPLVVLTDADCRPATPRWLTQMTGAMASPAVQLVLGYAPLQGESGLLGGWAAFEADWTALLFGCFARAGVPYMGVGRNMAFRTHLAIPTDQATWAQHQELAGGDDDLFVNAVATASNTVFHFHPDASVWSKAPVSWQKWFLQKQRHLQPSRFYRLSHRFFLTCVAATHCLHYFLFALLVIWGNHPFFALHLYAVRTLTVSVVFGKFFRKLRGQNLTTMLPIYDLMLAVYYGLMVPFILIKTKPSIPWK